MKLLLLIPDGVGIRNYLYSDVLKFCKDRKIQVAVLHHLDQWVIEEAEKLHDIEIENYPLALTEQLLLVRFLREATTFSRLSINARITNNPTILANWKKSKGSVKLRLLYFLSKLTGAFFRTYRQVEAAEKWLYALESKKAKNYFEILKRIKPDVIFCTHQRVAEISPLMIAAKQMRIKTATAIFSWDNLPKARLPYRTDRYFVWSDYMKKELLTFYPEILPGQIKVTGTPQFDFYRKKELLSDREHFAASHSLDFRKHWILFSGDDKTTSPYDHKYLADVAEALKDERDVQIIFRQVPAEGTERYDAVLKKHPEIVHLNPLWMKGTAWNYSYPSTDDVKMLVNLACHCKVVVNVGSTMALDFAHFDNPGLFLNYDQTKDKNWSVDTIYQFQHFRALQGIDATGWINSRSEIKGKIIQAISNPEEVGRERKIWIERITQPQSEAASYRIAEALAN